MAIDPHDLWIGDFVRSASRNLIGRFEGMDDQGMVKVKVDEEHVKLPASDLELVEQPEGAEKNSPLIQEDTPDIPKRAAFSKSIDLHIEVLNPLLANADPGEILRYQLRRCREFLENAISWRARDVRIIHGKGTGVLGREVKCLLEDHPGVWQILPARGDGALDVILEV